MAGTQRVDLSTGEWCELPAWVSHGQMKKIQRIVRDSKDADMDVQTKLIAELVITWSLKDEDGNDVPVNPTGIEKLDQIRVNEVFEAVTKLIQRATPNS